MKSMEIKKKNKKQQITNVGLKKNIKKTKIQESKEKKQKGNFIWNEKQKIKLLAKVRMQINIEMNKEKGIYLKYG